MSHGASCQNANSLRLRIVRARARTCWSGGAGSTVMRALADLGRSLGARDEAREMLQVERLLAAADVEVEDHGDRRRVGDAGCTREPYPVRHVQLDVSHL